MCCVYRSARSAPGEICTPVHAAHRAVEEIMSRFFGYWLKFEACRRFILLLLTITTLFPGSVSGGQGGQDDKAAPGVSEGALLYRSPGSGRYESVPLVHTDVALDVRGLVAAATVTQQYVNSSTEPIEAVYVFPLPHDGFGAGIHV